MVAEATEREARAKELKKKKSKEAAKADQEMEIPEGAGDEAKEKVGEQEDRNDQQTTSALTEDQSVWVYVMATYYTCAPNTTYCSQQNCVHMHLKHYFFHHKLCVWLYFLCAHKCIHISYIRAHFPLHTMCWLPTGTVYYVH